MHNGVQAMKTQATRVTQQQLAYLSYWQKLGYVFKCGDKIPESTLTPPGFAARRPLLDAAIGSLILAAFVGSMLGLWIKVGAGI